MGRSDASHSDRPEHDWQTEIVDTLLHSEVFSDPHARALLTWMVEAELENRTSSGRLGPGTALSGKHRPPAPAALLQCVTLVRHCDHAPGGLHALATSLQLLQPGSVTAQRVAELAQERDSDRHAQGAPQSAPTGLPPVTDTNQRSSRRDFFLSYASTDQRWAVWIAWELEGAGYRVLVQDWDFVPGSNWQLGMERGLSECERVVAVLSPAYVESVYGRIEWQVAQGSDPTSFARRLVPIRVIPCRPSGLLAALVAVDLVGLPVERARSRLLDAMDTVRMGRSKPVAPPRYPADPTVLPPSTDGSGRGTTQTDG
ncbi:toll/interleukin-1 receptor domain-containing protein [Streptomyces sp. NPDC047081]|uniref:toll/interleukin-1 receptor domain-containing protein n=1 Tax=Streptomyces sp. NPDC047081 TaxID=3154706 RepID=UPI0033ECB459